MPGSVQNAAPLTVMPASFSRSFAHERSYPVVEGDPAREKKQRKLWAYRQRTMSWANPYTWTRASFRRKLSQRFVESLMMWPPYWTSDQAVLGPEVMASWRSKALSHLSSLLGE